MIKKILLAVATMIALMGFSYAQVDVNKADPAALDGVKGIGPAKSKLILDERNKGGPFKDWADFEKRVKGVGAKSSAKLSEAGLQVGGQSRPGASMVKADIKAKPAREMKAQPAAAAAKPVADMAKPK
jgi:competence protein ComEA